MNRRTERRSARADAARKLDSLRALAGQPAEQARRALDLIATEQDLGVVGAAAEVLAACADASVRPKLHRVYAELGADPTKRDPGCHTRMALLRALRPIATPEDARFLADACATYEELPTGGGMEEVAGGLRGLALVILVEVDETLAAFHGARLLVDPRTPALSGEPAVTAARVLAAQGNLLPLYSYVLGAGQIPEVLAECLRLLGDLPPSLLPGVIERYLVAEDETILLGLFDLLLSPRHRGVGVGVTLEYVRETTRIDLARYLATTLVASRDGETIEQLEALAQGEGDGWKREVLEEALALR